MVRIIKGSHWRRFIWDTEIISKTMVVAITAGTPVLDVARRCASTKPRWITYGRKITEAGIAQIICNRCAAHAIRVKAIVWGEPYQIMSAIMQSAP